MSDNMTDISYPTPEIKSLEQRVNWLGALSVSLILATFVTALPYFVFNNKLNDKKNEKLAEMAEGVSQANRDARLAAERGSIADAQAKQFEAKSKEFEAKALSFQLQLEKERGNRQELAKSVAPLKIDEEKFVRALSKYANTTIAIEFSPDEGARQLGDQIVQVFTKARWQIAGIANVSEVVVGGSNKDEGVKVQTPTSLRSNDPLFVIAEFILKLFKDSNIDAIHSRFDDIPEPAKIQIHIGAKPYKEPKEQ